MDFLSVAVSIPALHQIQICRLIIPYFYYMAFQFKFTLANTNLLVWRQILVPSNYTFYQFHMAIQGAFEWENAHLFQFSSRGLDDEDAIGFPDTEDERTVRNAEKTKLSTIFKKRCQEYAYIYDFGDDWHPSILLEKLVQDELIRPFCLDGVCACPPEDCGGIPGYQQILEILSTPGHLEQKSYREWIGLEENETWDTGHCSKRQVNKRLALL